MFKKFKWKTADFFTSVKRSVSDNKYIYIIVLAAITVGFLIGIGAASDCEDKTNIIIRMREKEFSFLKFYFELILVSLLPYFIGWLLSFNKIVYFANLGTVVFIGAYFSKAAVLSCMAGISGVILLFFYLPIAVVSLFFFTEYLLRLGTSAFPCGKLTDCVSLKFNLSYALREVKRTLLPSFIITMLYSGVFLAILSLIF